MLNFTQRTEKAVAALVLAVKLAKLSVVKLQQRT